MPLLQFFRRPILSAAKERQLVSDLNLALPATAEKVFAIRSEYSFYVQCGTALDAAQVNTILWLLRETFEPDQTGSTSFLTAHTSAVVEVGPRMSFTSAFSTNATSICSNCGVPVDRLERYRRYSLHRADDSLVTDESTLTAFADLVHDRMTEWRVRVPVTTFEFGVKPEPVRTVPLLAAGRPALEHVNKEMGLSMDAWDLDFYYNLFVHDLKRDPTDVELFDICQSNSEHSRHWFFKGKMVLDGKEQVRTLMQLVQGTLDAHPANSIIAFADNSSAIAGFRVETMEAAVPGRPSSYKLSDKLRHCLLTAETHNFPTGVAPFPGAETGTGGRIRDTHATGRGSHVVAGTAAYCVGNLRIPGYPLPWEDGTFQYPPNLAAPLRIEIDASNGASDYGNKFGEPVVAGFTRSFGMRMPNGDRREYIKPIMFTAGVGIIDDEHTVKGAPEAGMIVVKLGGPAYRIGMGGSAASSMMQGENKSELDFNAVQRGDAEMEQKMNRVIRACCELGNANPIVSIHDQGAGGNCNVLKEIIAPAGGRIEVRSILVGDSSLSVLEIWGAEYQEADALLIRPSSQHAFSCICARERVSVAYVGTVTGDGRAVLHDTINDTCPVDMDLEKVLGHMPQKTFTSERQCMLLPSFRVPADVTISGALDRVLRLLSVGSKRFLTNKVDRSVTGLVAQQQCVGPLHTPLSNYAVIAHSYFAHTGVATSIGEQPVKSLVSPSAMARMAVAESITNMMGARITTLSDAKCSANWMWAAKLPHEGAALYDACEAMCSFMIEVGVAVDGGKDSLSMAAKAPDGELVKAPGSLVISLYCPCPDFRKNVTPDLKAPGASSLVFVDLSAALTAPSRVRIGASALSHVYGALGDVSQVPDCDDAGLLVRAFEIVQDLLGSGSLLSLHDRSDGGLVVTALEMAFAGNCGFELRLPAVDASAAEILFNEELGVLLEVSDAELAHVLAVFGEAQVRASVIGVSTLANAVSIHIGETCVLSSSMTDLRDLWEATSFQLERRQCNPVCVASEEASMKVRVAPPFKLSFAPTVPAAEGRELAQHRVAVLREEGSNGDREMSAALLLAGFDVWDITMSDLVEGRVKIDEQFRGLVFPGGFSYADVLDSAKGWAATIRFHPAVLEQLTAFYRRPDTFSLGVCNGCQLLALLGWVPFGPLGVHDGTAVTDVTQPRFVHNASGRFESRFSTVRINESPAIMFRGMQGSVLGVWVAHGEGQAHFEDAKVLDHVSARNLVPLSYVDDAAEPTEVYPFNPNGSPRGIAGLVTPDGRHLAIMPHPERVHRLWQWPWMPQEWKQLAESPWMQMFRNAKDWCDKTQ